MTFLVNIFLPTKSDGTKHLLKMGQISEGCGSLNYMPKYQKYQMSSPFVTSPIDMEPQLPVIHNLGHLYHLRYLFSIVGPLFIIH